MNKAELAEMNKLRRKAEEKKPNYERSIRDLKQDIERLERCKQLFTPDLISTMYAGMETMLNAHPDLEFQITVGTGYGSKTIELSSKQVRTK